MDSDKKKSSSTVIIGMCGGIAACTAEYITFPFDNVKTRIQMNGKDGMPKYNSTMHCLTKTLNDQSIKGFYKGVSAALLRQITYSTSRIWAYEKINRFFSNDVEKVGFFRKLLAGGSAGAFGCVIGTPADIFKIRLINDMMGKKYKGNL